MNEVLKWVGAIGAIWFAASILVAVAWWRIRAVFDKPVPKPDNSHLTSLDEVRDSRRGA